ncbi:hypothetical protein OF829_04505 [Sphingomonas sp. LB-2]|uniref:hypothetical protein n=1 Tax=Sphingomonas caeni TaxID=2984949 RepID=UPI00223201B1|nr:hypothetical protein [Sphingomonas caeni]MCW3846489.1 hypothetical protein [Sphingomonas caeni]
MRLLLIPAALILASPVVAGRDPQVPEATPIGTPVDCIPLSHIRNTRVRSDQVIDYYVGRKVYRNTLPMRCPGLGFEQRYLHKTSTGDICSHDIITVLEASGNMPGPSCGMGKFQEVTIAGGK